jgi:hypothetical protein
LSDDDLARTAHLSLRKAASVLGGSHAVVRRSRRARSNVERAA